MILICERCAAIIETDDIYLVVFGGKVSGKHKQSIVCGKCTKELNENFRTVFSSDLIDDCISINRIEVKSNDLQQL